MHHDAEWERALRRRRRRRRVVLWIVGVLVALFVLALLFLVGARFPDVDHGDEAQPGTAAQDR